MTDDRQGQDEQRVAEIRARVEAATPGPWKGEWDGQQYIVCTPNGDEIIEYTFAIPTWGERYEQAKATCDIADAAFIAHAREDVPWLLARLDALEAERDDALARLAAAEAALRWAERNTTHDLSGHGSNLLRMCRVCDQVGELDQIDHAPDCPFAALAGSRAQQGEG